LPTSGTWYPSQRRHVKRDVCHWNICGCLSAEPNDIIWSWTVLPNSSYSSATALYHCGIWTNHYSNTSYSGIIAL
jgi:hypothetical protein